MVTCVPQSFLSQPLIRYCCKRLWFRTIPFLSQEFFTEACRQPSPVDDEVILETSSDSFNKSERRTVKKMGLTHARSEIPARLSTGLKKCEEKCRISLCIKWPATPPDAAAFPRIQARSYPCIDTLVGVDTAHHNPCPNARSMKRFFSARTKKAKIKIVVPTLIDAPNLKNHMRKSATTFLSARMKTGDKN